MLICELVLIVWVYVICRVLGNVMLNFKLFVEGVLVVFWIFVFIKWVLLIDVDDILGKMLEKVVGNFEFWNVDFVYLFCRDVFVF